MDPAIARELAALREEIDSLRVEARGGQPVEARAPAADDRQDASKVWAAEVKDLIAAMQSAVETTGTGVAVHPIAGVATAFVAGVLIGRLTKSG